jgi:hypothetical protein
MPIFCLQNFFPLIISIMFRFTPILLIATLSQSVVTGFSVHPSTTQIPATTRLSPLFMGRAAAVRAATKSKTDGKKAKINALFGKKIIMAVKQVSLVFSDLFPSVPQDTCPNCQRRSRNFREDLMTPTPTACWPTSSRLQSRIVCPWM